ncbi:MAG: PDZ domain-containing protein [Verrucomicrobiaceae bacterium]
MKNISTIIRPLLIVLLLGLGSLNAFGQQRGFGQQLLDVGGIGIYIGTDETEYLLISKIIPDSPAAGAKLKEGEHITKVDGVSTKGKTVAEWMLMIRGPELTAVELEILGTDGKTYQRLLCRKKITPQ